jgi:glycosyltransferase involved in cell wall biosynthesis
LPRLRILLVNERLYPEFIGGVEKRNYDLARGLAGRGHEVTLAGFGVANSFDGISVESLGELGLLYSSDGRRSLKQALRFAWRLLRLDVSRYDVVETSNIPYIHILPLAIRCWHARKPLLVTWYEFWGPYWKTYVARSVVPFYRAVEWLTAQMGSAVVSTSRLTASRVSAHRRTAVVDILPCGIDTQSIARVAIGSRRSDANIVYAGRLIREKRVALLLEAFALLPAELNATLTIFGNGPERDALESAAKRLHIADRITFRGDVADASEVWKALGEARVAVQPSSREGFGIFPVEALSAGLPVVYGSGDETAVAETVRDGLDGLMCDPDPSNMSRAIARLITDDTLHERMSRSAKERAGMYDLPVVAARAEEVFAEVIERAQAARKAGRRAQPGES